jgi:hypothetical protein
MSLDALMAVQYGIVRRDQLLRAGLAPATLRRHLRSGEWRSVLTSIYAITPHPLDMQRRQVAGWLYAGPDAQLAGPTAAQVHGLRNAPDDSRVHLLVPHHRQIASVDFVVIHRTVRMEAPPVRVEPFAVCSVARALADTSRWLPDPPGVRALVAEAVERRRATVAELRAELSHGRRNGSALLRVILDEVSSGARRRPDQDLRTALLQSRELPGIRWNPRLVGADGRSLPWVDGWIEEVGMGVEVEPAGDGTVDDWEHTARRHSLLADYGVLVLAFPAARVRRDPAGVRVAVERAYRQRRATGERARAVADRQAVG